MASDPTQPGGRDDGMRPGRRQPDLLGEEDADIPPPPYAGGADPLDEDSQARLQRMSRRGRLLPGLLVLAAIGAFVAIVWWAYSAADRSETPTEIPVVEAEPGDEKVRPESEGGMEVPNRDKLIYEQLDSGEGEPEIERLLPPPEEPLEPPPPPPVETSPADSPPAETAAPETPAVPDTAELTPPPPPQEIQPGEIPGAESATGAAPAAETVDPSVAPEAEEPAPAAAEEAASEAPAPEAEAAPEPAPEPAPPAAAGGFRIQLAAVKDEAGARAEWDRLQETHAELLGGLQPTIKRADLGDQGVFFRIQGGPLASRDAAAALCERLKQQDQACLVVAP